MVQMKYLKEHPEYISELARWFEAEWAPYYGLEGPGDAEKDLQASLNTDSLPLTFIAIEQKQILGTISLKEKSISHDHLGPWLAALLVGDKYQGKGIERKLLIEAEQQARNLGFDSIYISTQKAKSLLDLNKWERIDTASSLRGEVGVYRLGF